MRRLGALDVGASKCACLIVDLDAGESPRIVAQAATPVAGLHRGKIVDPSAVAAALREAIEAAETMAESPTETFGFTHSGPGFATLKGQGYHPIFPNQRPVTREDLHQTLNHSRQQRVPIGQTVVADFAGPFRLDGAVVAEPLGRNAGRVEVDTTLVTLETGLADAVRRVIEETGVAVALTTPGPVASAFAVTTVEERARGIAVVDIGAWSTGLVAFIDGVPVLVRSLPVGAHHVTRDLQQLLRTTEEEAERLKLRHGLAMASVASEGAFVEVHQVDQPDPRPLDLRTFCRIIESRMREILRFAHEAMEETGLDGRLPAGAVLTGGGSALRGLSALGEETLDPMRVRTLGPRDDKKPRKAPDPRWSAAFGVVRQAMERGEDEIAPVNTLGAWKEKIAAFRASLGRKGP